MVFLKLHSHMVVFIIWSQVKVQHGFEFGNLKRHHHMPLIGHSSYRQLTFTEDNGVPQTLCFLIPILCWVWLRY